MELLDKIWVWQEREMKRISEIAEDENLLYFTEGEKKIYDGCFKDIFDFSQEGEFYAKFSNLIRGLDHDSKHCLIRCLDLIRRLNMCAAETMDIYTDQEKEELLLRKKRTKEQIIKLADNLWEYNGYILPINDFRSEIFEDLLGIGMVGEKVNIGCRDVIDVGAYIGDSSLVLSEITDGSVYAVEPIKKNIEYIKTTAEVNQKRIIPVHAAASDTNSIEHLAIGERIYNSSIKKIGNRNYIDSFDVNTITIDKFVSEHKLDVGLIKIHAEGAEQKVLMGAKETIIAQAPIIIVEINHTESDFYDIKPMIEKWQSRYKYRIFKPNNGLICLGLKLIAYI